MPTKIKHCVIDAETNEVLDGEPSPKLVEASGEADADGGMVLAIRTPSYRVSWDWGFCHSRSLFESLGYEVHTVYVEESKWLTST